MIVFESDKQGRDLEADVDQAISEFDGWFMDHLENSPLTGPERSVIKTFLYYVLVAKKKGV